MNRLTLSKKRHLFRAADAYVISVPKCGRTWLHFMVQHYHCTKNGIPFALNSPKVADPRIPNIVFTHDLWRHRTANRFLRRLKGRYLIPADCRAIKPVLLLTRDLRDVLVSLYFQLTKRQGDFSGSLSDLLVHPTYGAEATVDIVNAWWDEWKSSSKFLHVTYEELKDDTEGSLARILFHFGESRPDAGIIARSVEFAAFENMQGMEGKGALADKILTPGNTEDPDSFKVRRGVVGGYIDYLSSEDVAVIERAMARLKPRRAPVPAS